MIDKREVPRVEYDTRLGRRQRLRYAKYMLQIDFEAYYDAIPLREDVRNKFVFLAAHDKQLSTGCEHCRPARAGALRLARP